VATSKRRGGQIVGGNVGPEKKQTMKKFQGRGGKRTGQFSEFSGEEGETPYTPLKKRGEKSRYSPFAITIEDQQQQRGGRLHLCIT